MLHSAEKLSICNSISKKDRAYFPQVQDQMGVTGAFWCDFIVYTKKGILVERIAFDPAYWAELRQKLASYYFAYTSEN